MNKVKVILSVLFLNFTVFLFAQTINEAGEAFNNGIQNKKDKNYELAIKSYNKCIDICKTIGAEGDELKANAEKQLTNAYYYSGTNFYKSKKYDEAIRDFKKTIEIAEKTNNPEMVDKANDNLAKVYTLKGNAFYKKKDYERAITNYDKALYYNPKYFKAYYGKGLVYKKLEDTENFKIAMDKVIELAPADDKTAAKAKSISRKFYITLAGKDLQNGDNSAALNLLNISLEYGTTDPQAYYFYAIIYNNTSKWDKAIESAQKSLEYEKESKVNIYFELGKAYEGAGNKEAACDAYKKVTTGPNVEVAKHKITQELKCK